LAHPIQFGDYGALPVDISHATRQVPFRSVSSCRKIPRLIPPAYRHWDSVSAEAALLSYDRASHPRVKHTIIAAARITQFGVDPPSAGGPNNHSLMVRLRKAMNKVFGLEDKPPT
jgi:hypothetical protein